MKYLIHVFPGILITLICLCGTIDVSADGVVFATEEDLTAFDNLVVKSQSRVNPQADAAKVNANAKFQRAKTQLNQLVQREKDFAKGKSQGKKNKENRQHRPVFGDGPSGSRGSPGRGGSFNRDKENKKFPGGSPDKKKKKRKD